jgi:hypothetical protein
LETGINRISKPKRMPLFKLATEQWLATKRNLSRFTDLHYRQYVASLSEYFGWFVTSGSKTSRRFSKSGRLKATATAPSMPKSKCSAKSSSTSACGQEYKAASASFANRGIPAAPSAVKTKRVCFKPPGKAAPPPCFRA